MTDERPGPDTQRHGRIDAKRHGRIYSGHPRLACCDVVKAWMPGKRPGTDTQRHGRIYSGHPRLACCDVVKTWMASEVGPARLPQNKKLQVGPARLPHIIHNK